MASATIAITMTAATATTATPITRPTIQLLDAAISIEGRPRRGRKSRRSAVCSSLSSLLVPRRRRLAPAPCPQRSQDTPRSWRCKATRGAAGRPGVCGERLGRARAPAADNLPTAMASAQDSAGEPPTFAPVVGAGDPRRFTDSGIEVAAVYTRSDAEPGAEKPGEYPFTRGIHPEMYRERPWTMRQYAGYASAQESNARYRYLLEHGSTGLSMAFDLPTQLGLDSDDPRALGEVGRTGVAIDTIDDMRTAFDEIPLDGVSTSMTINAPASVLLCLYELVGAEHGVPAEQLRGTSQNDILKEYIARGNYIYPPGPSMRLTTDLFAYCQERLPHWNTISISGYHFREKGASAVQEVAFTLSSAIAYVQAAIDSGLAVDEFAPRLAFFFNAHNNVFQEVAKFRAARAVGGDHARALRRPRSALAHDRRPQRAR